MDIDKIRADFPFFSQEKKFIYFDNACMSLKPKVVIDALVDYYSNYSGCAGRSAHEIAKKVTDEVEDSRKKVGKFFNAKRSEEIIFTKNTTEGLNIVARGLCLTEKDVVLTTDKEHNSNLLPWQVNPCRHVVVPSLPDNTFDMEDFEKILDSNKVKLVSFVHTSNMDGVTIPAKEIIKKAHEKGALVMLDAAQSAPHKEVDVRDLDVDFLSCSGHKMLGPTATGVLYGKKNLLENLKPLVVGGETVTDSTYDKHTLEDLPQRLEPGLQHYAGIIGLKAAVEYLKKVGLENIGKHEVELNKRISEGLLNNEKVKLIGPENPELRGGIFSFNIEGMTPHSVALMLDTAYKILMRSGAHCVHSWFNKHDLPGSARASLYLYNSLEECDKFVESVKKLL